MRYFLTLDAPSAKTLAIAMQAVPGMAMKHDPRDRRDVWACLLEDIQKGDMERMQRSAETIKKMSNGAAFDPTCDLLYNETAPHVIFHPADRMTVQVAHLRHATTPNPSNAGVFLVTIEYSAEDPKAPYVFGMVLAKVVFRARQGKMKVFSFDPPAHVTARVALARYTALV